MNLKISSHHIQPRRLAINMARQATESRLLTIFIFLASFAVISLGSLSQIQAAQSQQHSWVGDVPIMG